MKKLALIARIALLTSVFFVCASCAKFPSNGSAAGFTRLTFSWTLAGAADPKCYYIVAIRVVSPPVGPAAALGQAGVGGPTPVTGTGSLNGIVGGLPTHYIIWQPGDPNGYEVYRFPLQNPPPNPSDPNTPLNLTMPAVYVGPCLPGTAVDPTPSDPSQGYGNQMGFTIDTSYLSQSLYGASGGQSIQIIQYNILTATSLTLEGGNPNGRYIDAIGDQSSATSPTFSDPIQVNITTTGNYISGVNEPAEVAGDTYPGPGPSSIDMVNWELSVTPPGS